MKKMIGIAVFSAMTGVAFAGDGFVLNGISGKSISRAVANEISINVPEAAKAEIISPERQAQIAAQSLTFAKGYVEPVEPAASIEWVTIEGGKFTMGTTSIEEGFEDARPIHEVTVKTFEMSKTAVTVEQYAECVSRGSCTKPGAGGYCNWGEKGRRHHPVNCVSWEQATQYARSKGARLPSEAEWEYAATSGGRNQKYPWGNESPTCERAVMYDAGSGCGNKSTLEACSKPAGNTAQGLCDMAGNVWQWVQDRYQESYDNAPVDGSAVEAAGSGRVFRGGSFRDFDPERLRADFRYSDGAPGFPGYDLVGFRLARSR